MTTTQLQEKSRLRPRHRPHDHRVRRPPPDDHQGARPLHRLRRVGRAAARQRPARQRGRDHRGRLDRHPRRSARRAPALGRLLRRREVPDANVREHPYLRHAGRVDHRRQTDDPRHHARRGASTAASRAARTIRGAAYRVGYSAHTTINRKDFGLAWNAALETGGVVVGDEVRIELNVEAIRKQ